MKSKNMGFKNLKAEMARDNIAIKDMLTIPVTRPARERDNKNITLGRKLGWIL